MVHERARGHPHAVVIPEFGLLFHALVFILAFGRNFSVSGLDAVFFHGHWSVNLRSYNKREDQSVFDELKRFKFIIAIRGCKTAVPWQIAIVKVSLSGKIQSMLTQNNHRYR